MRCMHCGEADLVPARFTYERTTPTGERLSIEVEGFVCPACGEEVLLGRDAERISAEWQRLTKASSPR